LAIQLDYPYAVAVYSPRSGYRMHTSRLPNRGPADSVE